MSYTVRFTGSAEKDIKSLDKVARTMIYGWLNKHIEGSDDSRRTGKRLTGTKSEYWRYRVGDYRIICKIEGGICTVLVIEVGHGSNVYNRLMTNRRASEETK